MHRSGTSMVTRMLEELGLFVGWHKDENHEALFFQILNKWLMRRAGCAWDRPEAFHELLSHHPTRELVVKHLNNFLGSPRFISYLGPGKYLRSITFPHKTLAWGWKDPRNTFTLPIWLDIFPGARIVHIFRHGVDVANSLRVREQETLSRQRTKFSHIKYFTWMAPEKVFLLNSVRCTTLEGGFSLWEMYLNESRKHIDTLDNRVFDIRYEDFIEDPYHHLESLAHFCCLPTTHAILDRVASKIKQRRRFAYQGNEELETYATKVSDRLSKFGY